MERYDFNTPINVTMIFEDSDDDSSMEKRIKIETDNNEAYLDNQQEPTETDIKSDQSNNNLSDTEEKSTRRILKANISPAILEDNLSDGKENTAMNIESNLLEKKYPGKQTTETKFDQSYSVTSIPAEPDKAQNNVAELPYHINENVQLTTHVKQLLDTVSEHLILVAKIIYYYDSEKLMNVQVHNQITKIKQHFFDLCYCTVVSLILPQDNNEIFVSKFIDKTEADANKKLNRICDRALLEQLYREMIEWAKRKKEYFRTIDSPRTIDKRASGNRLLKKRLAEPPQSFNISKPTNVPLNTHNNGQMNTENSMCIFSSGSPGREVSININPSAISPIANISNQSNNSKQLPVNEREPNSNCNNYVSNNSVYNTTRQQSYYCQGVNHAPQHVYYQNTSVHHPAVTQRPPPYYYSQQNNSAPMPPNLNYTLNQMHANLGHTGQPANDPLTTPIYSPMHSTEETRATAVPVITSVTSLAPAPNLMQTRCRMCGRATDSSNKYSYCSNLCQELDSGVHKTWHRKV